MQLEVPSKQATSEVPNNFTVTKFTISSSLLLLLLHFYVKRNFPPIPFLSANFKNTFNDDLDLNDSIRFKKDPSNNDFEPPNHPGERDG